VQSLSPRSSRTRLCIEEERAPPLVSLSLLPELPVPGPGQEYPRFSRLTQTAGLSPAPPPEPQIIASEVADQEVTPSAITSDQLTAS
jgi:hypothetical protein